jgi:uncharacterized protein (TIGR02145 family)
MKILIILLLTSFSFATIINIPADFSTIQEGIDASANGDTVLVQPNTYYENINFNGQNITLGSLFLTTADTNYISQTIIDGSQSGSVVVFEHGETTNTILTGFTITGGTGNYYEGWGPIGGGIYCGDASPKLENLIITENSASLQGGGIGMIYSNSIIENTTISYNTASGGGGLFAQECDVFISNSIISYNSQNTYPNGGGGIKLTSSNATIDRTIFYENTGRYGSAFHYDGGDIKTINITNCTFTKNRNDGGPGTIYSDGSPIINVINTLMWDNMYNNFYDIVPSSGLELNISYTMCYANGWNICSITPSDPLFIDPNNNNYYLQGNSPCIDAGDPNSEFDPDGTIADIGAYYYHQELGCTDPIALNYNPDATEDDGSCEYSCIDIDGNVYQTVVIGDQEWMMESLKVNHYRNGDGIPTGYSNEEWSTTANGAYSIYNNDSNNSEIYGNLYNWHAIIDERNISPEGWHVPTDEELMELELFLGMSQSEVDGTGWRGINEGSKLAGNADLWDEGDLKNNEEFGLSNFLAIPSGYRHAVYGTYHDLGLSSAFWSSTNGSGTHAWERDLSYSNSEIYRSIVYKRSGFSIRCIKDSEEENILGCTDPLATNFDSDANTDDGSCEYDEIGSYSLDFDGFSSFVEIPDTDILDMNLSDFTIEAWCLSRNIGSEDMIIGKMDGVRNGYGLNKVISGELNATFRKTGGYDEATINTSSDPVETNVWYHVTGVLDRDIGAKLYLNGILVDEVFDTKLNEVDIDSSFPLMIGKLSDYGAYWDGLINMVRIWNYARTPEQILSAFTIATQEPEEGLVGYWRFFEGSGNILYDLSGNNNNGTINGAIWSDNVPALGCMDIDALNYDPNADFDNDTCTYLEGCTDPLALNYDPDAIVDDGSCLYGEAGCNDETAYNFNENAEWNDGSCIYYGDINADGSIDVVDVIAMVGFVLEFVEPTPEEILLGDLYPDGLINIYDIVGVVSIILTDPLLDTLPLSEVTLTQENNSLKFSKTGSIAGIQIEYEGEFESSLEGWMIEKNENTILMVSMDGSDIEKLYYFGDLKIKSCSVVDWELNKLQAEITVIPDQFSLKPAYPNPFNPVTTFNYDIPYNAFVVIKAFDVRGKEVAELVNGMIQEGNHEVVWDASKLSSGMYFVRMTSGDFKAVQKIIFLK